jgi:hypothetical protein
MSETPIQEQPMAGVTIRRLGLDDRRAVERVAELDSATAPRGELLGAEIEGRLVAAIAIESGDSLADPFSRTRELRALLELRAGQLRRREPALPRFVRFRRRHARAALPSSPPGAGGRLLSLPSRPS